MIQVVMGHPSCMGVQVCMCCFDLFFVSFFDLMIYSQSNGARERSQTHVLRNDFCCGIGFWGGCDRVLFIDTFSLFLIGITDENKLDVCM